MSGTHKRTQQKPAGRGTKHRPPAGSPLATDERFTTTENLVHEATELYEKLRRGGTRDEISAMTSQKHLLDFFRQLKNEREEHEDVMRLTNELRETQRLLRGHSSASTSYEDAPKLPRKGSDRAN